MKKFIYFCVAIFCMAFSACDKGIDDVVPSEVPEEIAKGLFEQNEYNLDMRDFAMAVSEAINANSSFRELVYEEAKKQYRGAFDVVITHVADKKLTPDAGNGGLRSMNTTGSEFTVADLLEDALLTVAERDRDESVNSPGNRISQLRALTPSQSLINTLTEKYPKLQVSVPVHVEDLEDPNYIPPVAFISEEYQNGMSDYMVGFSQGNMIVIDGINEPERAVIVVGLNERTSDDLLPPPSFVPTPSNLTASAMPDGGVLLMWQNNGNLDMTSGYIIERRYKNNTTYDVAGEIYDNTVLSFIDYHTVVGASYSYRVRAFYNGPNGRQYSIRYSNDCVISGPPRILPDAPLSFSVTQMTSNYAELRWSQPNVSSTTKIYKNIVGIPSWNLIQEFGANEDVYNCWDTSISGGQFLQYYIQNETGTGASNVIYDYIHVSYRNPSVASPVKIKKMKCIGRDFEPWGMGPPEFRVKVVGANKPGKETYEINEQIDIDYGGTEVFGWNLTQHFDKHVCNWSFDPYETNYDVMTFYLVEADNGSWKEFSFEGKVATKSGVNMEIPIEELGNVSTGINVETGLVMKQDFFEDENLGHQDYSYYEPIDKVLTFYYQGSSVEMTLGQ